MLKIKMFIGILIIVTLSFIGCSKNIPNKNKSNESVQRAQQNEELERKNLEQLEEKKNIIEKQVESMALEEKIGQMVIVGLDGYEVDDNTRLMVEKYYAGGFILFKDNVKNPNQLLSLVNSLKNTNSENKIPLFISVDEEGGRVTRMPDELRNLPDNKKIGEIDDSELSYKIGKIIAKKIKLFGFNMNFAPVLDINSNPQNPVIGDRSFGSDANIVSKLGIQAMKGIKEENVISVVKHFPGHGDTGIDSHVDLPTVKNDISSLKSFELVPFKKAIDNGNDAMMIAHILLNEIDSHNPASLSKRVITDILRKDLNFNGVVITDDMTMGAIMENYSIDDAAIKSINAGSDIILVCHGHENAVMIFDSIKKAVENGVISEERINESVHRILKLKNKYKLKDDIIDTIDIDKINTEINLLYTQLD